MLPLLLAIVAEDDPLIRAARDRLAAERPCVQSVDSTDVTVCGKRAADRFRVPFIVHEPGDPRREGVHAERARLMRQPNACEQKQLMMYGCGHAGVTMTTSARGMSVAGRRQLAP